MVRYGMAVDTLRCVGCNNCAMACKVENNVPNGIWWNKAVSVGGSEPNTPQGIYPDLSLSYYTLSCQHCDTPACVAICSSGASQQREDGIVWIDWEICIGCKTCISACPYEGVRSFNESTPAYDLDFAVGDDAVPAHSVNVTEKCTFCLHRIDRGERPACADVCRAVARYFGDLDDPNSDISKVIAEREYEQLKTSNGTGPRFYLLK